MQIINKYFPDLSNQQISQFTQLLSLYPEWNEKINVISRKDIDNLEVHHILHSLAIARFLKFEKSTMVLDVGTGGGFPGIPLAIFFPETKFHLIDSIGKKIRVVENIADSIGLRNVKAEHTNVILLTGRYDYIVSRAVKPIAQMKSWNSRLLKKNGQMVFLKGGDLRSEIEEAKVNCQLHELSDLFDEEFFLTKKLLIC
ncbi:MAG: 16S rRNA (guanine(527)-N(7))-methyltransferase RsmG [Chitinophagales bacterium]|nr:16S rRNA (guanine(527)-N(7))-methyltransferase RsmG [Chitinophagales bacterium]